VFTEQYELNLYVKLKLNSFFNQNAALQTRSKFRYNVATQTQNSDQEPNIFPLLHTPNSPLPITLPTSLPNALRCYDATFTRRTNGQSGNPPNTKVFLVSPVIQPLTAHHQNTHTSRLFCVSSVF